MKRWSRQRADETLASRRYFSLAWGIPVGPIDRSAFGVRGLGLHPADSPNRPNRKAETAREKVVSQSSDAAHAANHRGISSQ
jgi:hypothetical protein